MRLRVPVIDRGPSAMPPSVLSRHEGADRLGEFIDENGGGLGVRLRKRHQKKS